MTPANNEAVDAERILEQASMRPEFGRAAQAFMAGRLNEAEHLARAILSSHPDDPASMLLLAEIATAAGLPGEALSLLTRASVIVPGHRETLTKLAELLFRQCSFEAALKLLDKLVAERPDELRAATIRLSLLTQIGHYETAEAGFRSLMASHPTDPRLPLGLAHLLRTLGRGDESAALYRSTLQRAPALGEAWWGLADLKAGALGQADIATIENLLDRGVGDINQALHLHFALGKAYEDAADYEASFRHYDRANGLTRRTRPYDANANEHFIDRSIALFDRPYFERTKGWGAQSAAPVFILGMPRAGSTLLEQMLASHPAIEGTAELPYIPQIAHELLAERWADQPIPYPDILSHVEPAAAERFGTEYLARAAVHRRTDRPFFIDKLNDNWQHIGLIQTILPNAIIIDARREAMACSFANFKQHFARGRDFAYAQRDIARYYRDYVRLLAHLDQVLPGRVLRVEHERLVADPEAELSRVLDSMGLEFDPACLRFYENARPVRTASASQVRQPLNPRSGELWRHYRGWLGDMERSLGDIAPD